MNHEQFIQRFPPDTFIGQDTYDEERFGYYHDNGTDVGVWWYNPRDTTGHGEILPPLEAEQARSYYRLKPVNRREHLAELDHNQVRQGYEAGFNGKPEPDRTYSRSYHHGWRNGAVDAGRRDIDDDQRALGKSVRRWMDVVIAAKGLETPTDERIRKGLERALMILDRDGLQAIRGYGWTDTDREVIEDGLKALEEKRETQHQPRR